MEDSQDAKKRLAQKQLSALAVREAENRAIQALARMLHREKFPEQYEFADDGMAEGPIAKTDGKSAEPTARRASGTDTTASNEGWESCVLEASDEIAKQRARVDEVLFYKWDPLHFSNSTLPRDEYASYVPDVFRLALESESPDAVADYLTYVATERMCMNEDRQRDLEVARLIHSLVRGEGHLPDHEVIEVQ